MEPVIEYDILAKDATNAYEWVETLAAVLGADVAAATIDLEKRIIGHSIGAKLLLSGYDTISDEYWLFKGCKINEFEIYSEQDDNVHVRESIVSIGASSYGTSDYVSGSATRETFPTTEPIVNGDCDLTVQGTSIMADALSWALRIRRNLERHGSDATTGILYDKLIEGKCEIELEVTMDFVSRTHLDQFLNATKVYAELKIPSASGGRMITLSTSADKQGVWRTMRKPARELDLINLTLVGNFDTAEVTTIT